LIEDILKNYLKLSKQLRGLMWSKLGHINLVSLYMLHEIYCRKEMQIKIFWILFLLLLHRNILYNYLCLGTERIEAIKVFIHPQVVVSLIYQFDLFVAFDLEIMVHYSFGSKYCQGWQHHLTNNQYGYLLRHIFHFRNQTF
jgi:hypothetical protein